MDKKRKMIVIVFISAVVVITAIAIVSFMIFRRNTVIEKFDAQAGENHGFEDYVKTDEYTELIGLFDDEDTARRAADLYGIEFEKYESGLAVFHVSNERDIDKLLKEGRKKNWPTLEYNHLRHMN
ncbi:MAG: hypothetical protein K6F34_01815 [Lachnospiraceae bacterium]|nr:hypothetical protein [Lachnospiraceae bacterium]